MPIKVETRYADSKQFEGFCMSLQRDKLLQQTAADQSSIFKLFVGAPKMGENVF